jgi:hypothetical protein
MGQIERSNMAVINYWQLLKDQDGALEEAGRLALKQI